MTFILPGGKKRRHPSSESRRRQELRLLFFQSTSPEELYRKKIDDQEYGEAVLLARHYGLDCNPVYERQWRLSTHGTHAVADYLSKISDRAVVLRECLEVVPESVEAMEGLLRFGVRSCGDEEHEAREKLEVYLRRLTVYEDVLDAQSASASLDCRGTVGHFEPAEFAAFRLATLLDSALDYALKSDVAAVGALMDVEDADSLCKNFLEIIGGFPEYLDPALYHHLLTQVSSDKATYQKREDLRGWFENRAREVEQRTGMAENALKLCEIGLDLGLRIDPVLYHSLSTLVTLTYDTLKSVSLVELEKMSGADVLVEMMRGSTGAGAASKFDACCSSFLARMGKEDAWEALKEYMARAAAEDFETALRLLQSDAPRAHMRDAPFLCEKVLFACPADTKEELLVEFSSFVTSPSGRPLVLGTALVDLPTWVRSLQALKRCGVSEATLQAVQAGRTEQKTAEDMIRKAIFKAAPGHDLVNSALTFSHMFYAKFSFPICNMHLFFPFPSRTSQCPSF